MQSQRECETQRPTHVQSTHLRHIRADFLSVCFCAVVRLSFAGLSNLAICAFS